MFSLHPHWQFFKIDSRRFTYHTYPIACFKTGMRAITR